MNRRPGIEILVQRIRRKHPHWPNYLVENEAKEEYVRLSPSEVEQLKRAAEKQA